MIGLVFTSFLVVLYVDFFVCVSCTLLSMSVTIAFIVHLRSTTHSQRKSFHHLIISHDFAF